MSGMASIRRNYGVPAYRGAEVTFTGWVAPLRGRIASCDGTYLWLRLERNGQRFGPLHPTWKMDYGDGRDYGAETNERIRQFNESVGVPDAS